MISEKYAKYYKSKPVGDFTKLYPELTAPSFHIWGKEWDSGYRMDWFCVTEPFLMINDPHTHDFDQIIFFLGGDPNNIGEFGAEVEMHLGEDKHIINYTSCVHIPAGLMHGPLNIKRVTKPIVFIDITLSPGHSIRPIPPETPRRE